MNSKISIILRTKNEEFWIERFMNALDEQEFDGEIEVVLVDNCSTDHTISRARTTTRNIKVVSIDQYVPGAALNKGLAESSGEYIVCISAHCIPSDSRWLIELIAPLGDKEIAAVYGRQIPLLTSDPKDKRDLWLTFPLDDKLQSRDPFLHNANAAYRRADLIAHPFCEEMTNIEDRGWASLELQKGRKIYYASKAVVYHDHGIHQTGSRERLEGVINMMDTLHQNSNQITDYYGKKGGVVPPSCCLIVPISDRYADEDLKALESNANLLTSHFSDWKIYIMPKTRDQLVAAQALGFLTLDFRIGSDHSDHQPLVFDISRAVKCLTERSEFYDYVGTFDIRRWMPSVNFIDCMLLAIQSERVDTAIAAKHRPKPVFSSASGESYQMEYAGWLNWLDGFVTKNVPVLDPSAFILAKMDVFRKGNPLAGSFCAVEIDD